MSPRTDARQLTRPRHMMGAVVAAAALLGVIPTAGALAQATPTNPSASIESAATTHLVPLTPCRLVDSRSDTGFTDVADRTRRVQVTGRCDVPTDAVAASITVTAVGPATDGFATVHPSGSARPDTSVLNWVAGEHRANSVTAQLGDGGSIDLFTSDHDDQIIVDVTAVFVPTEAATAGRFVPIAPIRHLDTRRDSARLGAEEVRRIDLPEGVPADATALVANFTTVSHSPTQASFLTAFPAGTERPIASTQNTVANAPATAAASIVPVNADGFDVYSHRGAHLVVDITGYFTGESAASSQIGLFVPSAPVRILDTRTSDRLSAGSINQLPIDEDATAISAIWTMVDTQHPGFVSTSNDIDDVATSMINNRRGRASANTGIVSTTNGGIGVFAETGTHLIVDQMGYFTKEPPPEPEAPSATTTSTTVPPATTTTTTVPSATPVPTTDPSTVTPPTEPPGEPPTDGDPLPRPWSAHSGEACADGVEAEDLNAFFALEQATLFGADYQRAFHLGDGRVLWMFQDAFARRPSGGIKLLHNAGLLQSGNCFTLLRTGTSEDPESWLFAEYTDSRQLWYWPMGGELSPDGATFHLFMAEMDETGERYLGHTVPTRMWLVDIAVEDLSVTGAALAPDSSTNLYGFDTASDDTWTYLYANCHRQFGFGLYGPDPCASKVLVARVPAGELHETPTYWNGVDWVDDPDEAVSVFWVDNTTADVAHPVDVMWDGETFRLATKPGDWFGDTIRFYTAPTAVGPWLADTAITHPVKCDPSDCNTYYVSWVPWRNLDGSLIWSISHNRWVGVTDIYRPTFHRKA